MSLTDFSRCGLAQFIRIPVCRQAISSLVVAVFLGWPVPHAWTLNADAQDVPRPLQGYATFEQMQSRLETLTQSPRAKLTSLGETIGERPIWLLTVADDPQQSRPAVLVIGSVTGPHVLGRELATRMAEQLVEQAESDPESIRSRAFKVAFRSAKVALAGVSLLRSARPAWPTQAPLQSVSERRDCH